MKFSMNRSEFVSCQNGNNYCEPRGLYRRGGLIRLVGYDQTDLTLQDALQLAEAILAMCRTNQSVIDTTPETASGNITASNSNDKFASEISSRLGSLVSDLSEAGVLDSLDPFQAIRTIQEMNLTAALCLERLQDDLEYLVPSKQHSSNGS